MKKITILMTVLLIATFTTFAQHSGGDHKHGSPHGGTVKSAGDFHIEVSVKDGMVMAYLLDANEKAMKNTGVAGTAVIQMADGQTSTITLIPNGNDGFMYTLDKAKKYNKAIVTFTTGGKNASASFDLTAKAKPATDGHDHQH
ncbi:MAG: hypothetical protein HYI21_05765 [Sediminibacterium sp. Gen4]|jgi:hypothetical protein|uniref:hypothetical protein n=1 Tax=unclassified Sediminibacterium TaxID=2635961 RepID=UPI0015BC0920|nr:MULTISPECIES: hypothetical protein [unclassified Sediminibacterium]MBW0164195.1 hypothetical protein [Sediminibacterium sp.]NWK65513.1 hypothetical protein [Sediminibacterium sp. Gen4]